MCLILVATNVGRPCDALTTFMPAVLIAISNLSWGSFSYFGPEHKASFVLRIKGGEGFEEQGSIS